MGHVDMSEKLYSRALEIRRKLAQGQPERMAPHVALSANYLGLLYCETNRPAQAAPLLAESLRNYFWLYRRDQQLHRENLFFVLKIIEDMADKHGFHEQLQWLGELWQDLLQRFERELVYIADELAGIFHKYQADELALEARVFLKLALEDMNHEQASQAAEDLDAVCAELGPWAAEARPELERRLRPFLSAERTVH